MGNPTTRVLVLDDEASSRVALKAALTAKGFTVSAEPTGQEAIELLRTELFDAVVLDPDMPGIGGVATCRLLRRQYPQLGILILTVRQGRQDKIEALEGGADDYIVKPFDLPELVARVRAVIRRVRPIPPNEPVSIRIGELELNRQERTLTKAGQPVHLTPNEFALLHCLMSHAGELVPYKELFRVIWDLERGGDRRRLRTLVRQMRKKIQPCGTSFSYLGTEPGFGYRFRAVQQ